VGHLAVYFACLAGNASSWVKLNVAVVHLGSHFLAGFTVVNNIGINYKTDDVVSRVLFKNTHIPYFLLDTT
jgi:hypothetical protein